MQTGTSVCDIGYRQWWYLWTICWWMLWRRRLRLENQFACWWKWSYKNGCAMLYREFDPTYANKDDRLWLHTCFDRSLGLMMPSREFRVSKKKVRIALCYTDSSHRNLSRYKQMFSGVEHGRSLVFQSVV